jgi:hypothetical protein
MAYRELNNDIVVCYDYYSGNAIHDHISMPLLYYSTTLLLYYSTTLLLYYSTSSCERVV